MSLYSKSNLSRLETIFITHGFSLRYEKGNFNSGYCMLKEKKIAVVNKFFKREGKFQALVEMLSSIEIDPSLLDKKDRDLLKRIFGKNIVSLDYSEHATLSL
jgi:hypothetical protein